MWTGPRMQLSGKLLSITSAGTEYYEGMYREADGLEEVRKAAREQLKAGADLIKVLATGAILTPGEKPGAVQFGLDELRVAVEEAAKVGKPVAAHAHGIQGIRNAVMAGVRTIEHGTYLHQDETLMETMAEREIFLVPTLKPGFDVIYGDDQVFLIGLWRNRRRYKRMPAKRATCAELGVPIAMGTDAATPYNFHGDNAMELVWMAEAGLSPMQTIVASTANAARALGGMAGSERWNKARLQTSSLSQRIRWITCVSSPIEATSNSSSRMGRSLHDKPLPARAASRRNDGRSVDMLWTAFAGEVGRVLR